MPNNKPLMIAIHCGGMPFNGNTIQSGKSLGGSESAAFFMARELARRNHKVVCFTNLPEPGRWDEVIYDHVGKVSEHLPLGDRFHYAMRVPWDVVIVQRHPLAFAQPVNSKLNIWWLHDLALHRMVPLVDRQLPFIDQFFTVSEFHRKQVSDIYGIDKQYITATFNGVDYSLFEQIRKNPPSRDRKSLVFASRPERGLAELVDRGGIMEQLPDFTLHVCGYDNTTAEMAGFYQYLWARCEELPNVKNHGPLGKQDLYQLLARCGAYVYPTTFEDTSNIMLLESNAVGTPFIGPKDHAALAETGAGAGFIGVPLAEDGSVDKKAFTDAVKSLCNNDSAWDRMSARALEKHQDWSSAAEQWEQEFYRILEEKSSDKVRLTKHFEYMSDIEAIMRLHGGNVAEIEKILPDFRENYDFFLNDTFKDHYEEYYQYEARRGVVYGPEDLSGNARFEHTASIVKEINPQRLLDYGCAHGHYVMNLLKRFPQIQMTGLDIEQTNINKAIAWAEKEDPIRMPQFICGTVEDLPQFSTYDCILACEVLEHCKDPVAVVEQLKKHLTPNGYIVITTPYGAWEAIGYKEHKGWRAHLHHFERWDLFDMFSEQPDYKLLAVPHSFDLGHNLVHFKAGGPPCKQIDYERKMKTQAPRETIALCMIAKDAELTIGKTLDKVADLVDEIHIAIDENTSDETMRIAAEFNAAISFIKSPIEIGFAEARNLSIADAKSDWILWLDADEHFERTENVAKYLRRSPIVGFGVPQHHYSEEPAGILKTDYPCRIFRNNCGVKFFGLVHEHPEIKMNDGVGKVKLIDDFGIMHFGYSTERIRRKRFERNWPLMVRDFEANPQRVLGQFLWLRDLAHMCKYTLERTGGRKTEEIIGWAEMAIQMWDKVCETRNIRLIGDALQFYSEAVHHLVNGNGIEYELALKVRKGALVPTIPTLRGYFLNSDHIEKFSKIIHEESVKVYKEKYF